MPAVQLTLTNAISILQGCFEKSRSLQTRPIAAAVVDAGGHLLALQRDEKGGSVLAKIAIAKASGSVAMKMSSRQLAVMAEASTSFLTSVSPLMSDGIIAAAGALLIVDAAGNVLGAVSVAGDLPDNDETCASAGLSSAGF